MDYIGLLLLKGIRPDLDDNSIISITITYFAYYFLEASREDKLLILFILYNDIQIRKHLVGLICLL